MNGAVVDAVAPAASKRTAMMMICIVVLAGSVLWFAFHQDIWIDESTQLSGINLSPVDLIRWLAGEDQGRFGVPGDRMPPVSYLIDWAWGRLVSPSELSIRLMHAAIATAGALVLAAAVRRAFSPAAAIVLTLLFALSTRFVQAAVEIRAYPVFVGLTCVILALHLRITLSGRRITTGEVLGYGLLGALLAWTHFFGVVAWFSMAAGLLWHFRADRISLARIATTCAAVLLWSGTLVPFAFASATLSDAPTSAKSAVDLLFFMLRLLVGSIEMIWPAAAAALIAGAGSLLLASLLPWFLRERVGSTIRSVDSIIVALVVGTGVTMAAAFLMRGFEPLKPSYSIWTLPLIYLLLVAGWQIVRGPAWWHAAGRHLALLLVIGGSGTAAVLQWAAPTLMIHGPHRFLARQLALVTDPVVVYDSDSEWGYGYFPLRFSGKGRIEQWRVAERSGQLLVKIVDGPVQPAPVSLATALAGKDSLVLTRIRSDRYGQLRGYLRGQPTGIAEGALFTQLQRSGDWHLEGVAEQPGYYSVRSWTWRRLRANTAGQVH